MQYVIWGEGKRGRQALELLGKQKVVAFVDSDTEKVGQKYDGIPIYDLDAAIRFCKDYVYIITPLGYEKEIEKILRSKGINKYIEVGAYYPYIYKNDFFLEYEWDLPKDRCAIYNINLFNILLYEHLNKNIIKDVILIPSDESKSELIEEFAQEYNITYKESLPNGTKIIATTTEEKELLSGYNVERLSSILNRSLPIFNEELLKFRNIHKDRKCFIVATGPSLKVEDLEKLKENNIFTLSMNRIYNIFSRTKWRPDYYVIQDYKAIEDLANEIADLELPYKFVSYKPDSYWDNPIAVQNSIKFKLISEPYKNDLPNFSSDIARGIFEGYTVTYACIQIAMYMGFSDIYLLGLDFEYTEDLYSDKNHFQGYQSKDKIVRLNAVRPDLVELAYKKARAYGEEREIKIYNATRGGKLEIFPRVDFDSLF